MINVQVKDYGSCILGGGGYRYFKHSRNNRMGKVQGIYITE